MHSLISIVGVVLSRQENYQEWFWKIKNTLIFNDLWEEICECKDDNESEQPTDVRQLAIWKSKDKEAHALISASDTEEVSRHILSNTTTFKSLQKLKDLYDSHSKLEIIQLLMKLFNLGLKDNNPMRLVSIIKAIFHDIHSTGVKVDLQLTAFIKALYPTYSHYLESIQASGQMKAMTFDTLVDKIVEREKAFGKKESFSTPQLRLCVLHRKNRNLEESLLDLTIVTKVMVGDHLEAGGVIIIKETNNKMIDNKNIFRMINNLLRAIDVVNWVIPLLIVTLLGKGLVRRKSNNLQTKENHLNLATILLHIVILVSIKFLALLLLLGKTLGF
jgi:hypothetical protein